MRITFSRGINEILFQKDLGTYGERIRGEDNVGRRTIMSASLADHQSRRENNGSSNEVLRMEKRSLKGGGLFLGLD